MFAHLDAARPALASAATFDATSLDDGAALAALREIAELRRRLDAAEAHLLAHLSATEGSDRREGMATSRWWARESGIPAGHARARVATANRLTQLPELDAALSAGEIAWERVEVICSATNDRNVEAMAAIQPEMLDLARTSTYGRFRRDVSMLGRLADPDGPEPADEDESRLHLMDLPGGLRIRGDLFGAAAAAVRSALDTGADRLFHRHRTDRELDSGQPMPTRAQLRAEALAELCQGTRHPVVRLVVGGPHGDEPTVERLLCDPLVWPVIVDADGEVLDVGRERRLFTDEIRTALDVRDGGCVFPGCEAPSAHCDAHHVRHWRRGGRTGLHNGALLCRHHHTVVHRRDWNLVHDEHGELAVVTPDGRVHPTQRHGRARAPAVAA